jgi:hypothetical protein
VVPTVTSRITPLVVNVGSVRLEPTSDCGAGSPLGHWPSLIAVVVLICYFLLAYLLSLAVALERFRRRHQT